MDIPFQNLYKLKRAIRFAQTVNFTSDGEPLVYPRFEEALRYIYSLNQGKSVIRFSTNGSMLSSNLAKLLNSHLNYLNISLNAASAFTYNRDMKQGNFYRTTESVREFMNSLLPEERGKVCLHLVSHKNNYLEIVDFVKLAQQLGISMVSIGQYFVNRPENRELSILFLKDEYNKVIAEAKKVGNEIGVTVSARSFDVARELSKCTALENECYIDMDGDAFGCCVVTNEKEYSMGNVYKNGFEKVWFSKSYLKIRKTGAIPACNICPRNLPFEDYHVHSQFDMNLVDQY